MVSTILWTITLGYNVGATFVWSRTFKDLSKKLHDLDNRLKELKFGLSKLNTEEDGIRMDLLEAQSDRKSIRREMETIKLSLEEDCKSRHQEACEMYNARFNYYIDEMNKKKKRGRPRKENSEQTV